MPPAPIPENESGRLAELDRYSNLSSPSEAIFDRITRLATHIFRCPVAILSFVAEERQLFISCTDESFGGELRSNSFCAWTVLGDSILEVPDARSDARFFDNPRVTGNWGIRFYAGAPLISQRGYNLGTLCVVNKAPRPQGLSADEREDLTHLAALAMSEFESRLTAQQAEETHDLLRTTLASIGDGVIVTDAKAQITFINPAAEAITGWRQEGTALPLEKIFDIVDESSRERVANPVVRALASGKVIGLANHTVLLTKDGREVAVDDSAAPVFRNGKTVGGVLIFRDVTKKRATERALEYSENQYRTTFAKAPLGLVLTQLNGRFLQANEAYRRLTGYSEEELPTISFISLTHPAELENNRRLFQQLVSEEIGSYVLEKRIFNKQGELRWVRAHATLLRNSDGHATKVIGLVEDVTERKQAEQRFRFLAESIPQMVWTATPDGLLDYVNERGVQYFNASQESLMGTGWLPWVHPEDRAKAVERWAEALKIGNPYETEFRLKKGSEGEWRLHLVRALPLVGENGHPSQWFGTCTDIEDQHQAARAARKAIEESENQFRTLAETIPHLTWMADEGGNSIWYNRRWYEFTGTTFEEMGGWGWEKVHDPKVLPEVMKRWKGALSSGEPFEMIYPIRRADGVFRPFLTRVEPIHDRQGRVFRWFGTNTDITDQQRTEEELRRMNRDLEEFSYVASHDLQEPLRMVSIYTQLLLRGNRPEDELQAFADFVAQGVKRMEVLIRDLLEFSRSVHTEEQAIATADLPAAVQEALSVLGARISEAGAVITVSELPTTRGDTRQMAHVFQNILSNALKYRKATATPEIDIAAQRQGDQWVISVRDNGIGFEPRYADQIFGLFKRLHKDEYEGTGLGLAICKRIVERYGGRMWATSSYGCGATFLFSLPSAHEH